MLSECGNWLDGSQWFEVSDGFGLVWDGFGWFRHGSVCLGMVMEWFGWMLMLLMLLIMVMMSL